MMTTVIAVVLAILAGAFLLAGDRLCQRLGKWAAKPDVKFGGLKGWFLSAVLVALTVALVYYPLTALMVMLHLDRSAMLVVAVLVLVGVVLVLRLRHSYERAFRNGRNKLNQE